MLRGGLSYYPLFSSSLPSKSGITSSFNALILIKKSSSVFCIRYSECLDILTLKTSSKFENSTICFEVKIPEDSKIYKTGSDNGIYLSDRIILKKPRKVDDNLAMELYLNSTLPEKSYFICIAVCAICGYINTALKVLNDKVNEENIDIAIQEFEKFCERREEEKYITDISSIKCVKILYDKLKHIQNAKN